MAIIRLGAIVPAISGKVGGTTFQTGGKSPVIRRKTNPRPRNTQIAMAHRVRYQHLTHAWRALTDDERAQWNYLGTQTQLINRLGLPRNPSGRELYFREELINQLDTAFPTTIPTESTFTPPLPLITFPFWQQGNMIVTWVAPVNPTQEMSAIYALRTGSSNPIKPPGAVPYLDQAGPVNGINIAVVLTIAQGTPAIGEWINVAVRVRGAGYLWSKPTTGIAQITV